MLLLAAARNATATTPTTVNFVSALNLVLLAAILYFLLMRRGKGQARPGDIPKAPPEFSSIPNFAVPQKHVKKMSRQEEAEAATKYLKEHGENLEVKRTMNDQLRKVEQMRAQRKLQQLLRELP